MIYTTKVNQRKKKYTISDFVWNKGNQYLYSKRAVREINYMFHHFNMNIPA